MVGKYNVKCICLNWWEVTPDVAAHDWMERFRTVVELWIVVWFVVWVAKETLSLTRCGSAVVRLLWLFWQCKTLGCKYNEIYVHEIGRSHGAKHG